jgi:hypothetical protein
VADRGADALHLVGADRRTHPSDDLGTGAGAAHHPPALGLAAGDGRGDLSGNVGEIDRLGIVGADPSDDLGTGVGHLVAALADEGHELGLQGKASVIGTDDDFLRPTLS